MIKRCLWPNRHIKTKHKMGSRTKINSIPKHVWGDEDGDRSSIGSTDIAYADAFAIAPCIVEGVVIKMRTMNLYWPTHWHKHLQSSQSFCKPCIIVAVASATITAESVMHTYAAACVTLMLLRNNSISGGGALDCIAHIYLHHRRLCGCHCRRWYTRKLLRVLHWCFCRAAASQKRGGLNCVILALVVKSLMLVLLCLSSRLWRRGWRCVVVLV